MSENEAAGVDATEAPAELKQAAAELKQAPEQKAPEKKQRKAESEYVIAGAIFNPIDGTFLTGKVVTSDKEVIAILEASAHAEKVSK